MAFPSYKPFIALYLHLFIMLFPYIILTTRAGGVKVLSLALKVTWHSFLLLIQLLSIHFELASIKEPPVLYNFIITFSFSSLKPC